MKIFKYDCIYKIYQIKIVIQISMVLSMIHLSFYAYIVFKTCTFISNVYTVVLNMSRFSLKEAL